MATTTVPSVPGFDMGPHTYRVPMSLFAENRQRLCKRLRERGDVPAGALVLLRGGFSHPIYHSDILYNFRQESNFMWAFGVEEPGFLGAINVDKEKCVLFMPRPRKHNATWTGRTRTPAQVREKYGVDAVYYADEIAHILESFYEWSPSVLLLLVRYLSFLQDGADIMGETAIQLALVANKREKRSNRTSNKRGLNTDSNRFMRPAKFKGIKKFEINKDILYTEIAECRSIKSAKEIDVIRYANKIASEAHIQIMKKIRPGMKEYQAEAIFLQYCYYVGGCRNSAYTCISASGKNSAVLSYGQASAPNEKTIHDGDMCLFDMGCCYCGYNSDITCSYPANGKFTDDQRYIYNAALRANRYVIRAMAPGVSWVYLHLLANRVLLQDLTDIGLLQGDVEDMIRAGLAAVFQPHGLGHLLGVDVHDVGGYLPGYPKRPLESGLNQLRTARLLETGMVVTVGPGCYFIDSVIESARHNQKLNQYLVPEVLMRYKDFGGVRVEDDVVIFDDGVEILTKVPRFVEQIEEVVKIGKATLDEICACPAD